MNNHSELVNKCISSSRENITGYYFYNSIKKAWFKVTKSTFLYVSFTYSFGCRWGEKQHLIIDSERVTSKKAKWLNECHNKQFNEVRV